MIALDGRTPARPRIRRSLPKPLIFNTASTPGPECSLTQGPQSPLDRLKQLNEQILTVPQAYCAKPRTSQACVAALQGFYRRAVALDPVLSAQFGGRDPVNVVCASPQVGKDPTARKASRAATMPVSANASTPPPRSISGPAVHASWPSLTTPSRAKKQGPTRQEVDDLERDWWSSEAAAMWYGPRPGNRLITVSLGDAGSINRAQRADSWESVASAVSGTSDVAESSGDGSAGAASGQSGQAGNGGNEGDDADIHRKASCRTSGAEGHRARHDLAVHLKPHSWSSGIIRRSEGFARLHHKCVARPVKA